MKRATCGSNPGKQFIACEPSEFLWKLQSPTVSWMGQWGSLFANNHLYIETVINVFSRKQSNGDEFGQPRASIRFLDNHTQHFM